MLRLAARPRTRTAQRAGRGRRRPPGALRATTTPCSSGRATCRASSRKRPPPERSPTSWCRRRCATSPRAPLSPPRSTPRSRRRAPSWSICATRPTASLRTSRRSVKALAAKRRWVRLADGSVAELSQRVGAGVRDARHAGLGTGGRLPRHVLGEVASWSELADHDRARRPARRLDAPPARAVTPERHSGGRSGAGRRSAQLPEDRRRVACRFLSELGAGGILADDMGLGRRSRRSRCSVAPRATGRMPSLVVAPTSVAPNWIPLEAERFVPGLKCILLHGLGRHAQYEDVPDADLVVTTYAAAAPRRRAPARHPLPLRDLDRRAADQNHAAATTTTAKSLHARGARASPLTGTSEPGCRLAERRRYESGRHSDLDIDPNPGCSAAGARSTRRYAQRPVVAAPPARADGRPKIDPDLEDAARLPTSLARAAGRLRRTGGGAARCCVRFVRAWATRAQADVESVPAAEDRVRRDRQLTPAQQPARTRRAVTTRAHREAYLDGRRADADGFETSPTAMPLFLLTALAAASIAEDGVPTSDAWSTRGGGNHRPGTHRRRKDRRSTGIRRHS